ncbi:MAG: histone deacetylase [Anaerolineales bacterium]|nr:histone deacetylase [Anaerolineales bacterium]
MPDLAYFYPQGHAEHAESNHPERPERVESIRQALVEAGWWDPYPKLAPERLSEQVFHSIHAPAYLHRLENACQDGRRLDMDTFTTPQSWQLALNAAGGAVAVARAVWRREAWRGFALCRPPGHHATADQGMGFCLLNNVALAAETLLQIEGALSLAIIDLDLHHGNGTQDIFYARPDVLYISTHQSPLYPGSGQLDEIGAGRGLGTTANFPMPPMSGDAGFLAVMRDGILPLLDRFGPQMLLVSYGFDPHWKDPLGNLLLSAAGYAELIAALVDWADRYCEGKIALFLEGGYDLQAAAACAQGSVAALLGRSWEDPLGPSPYLESQNWRQMLAQAKNIWK